MPELSERIGPDDSAQIARHPDFPNVFTRNRKLPLSALDRGVAVDVPPVPAGDAGAHAREHISGALLCLIASLQTSGTANRCAAPGARRAIAESSHSCR
jgi:hypothetical protein